VFAFFINHNYILAQKTIQRSSEKPPNWLKGTDAIQSSIFQYYIGEGNGVTVEEARKNALQNVILQYAETLGTDYIVGSESTLKVVEQVTGGSFNKTEDFYFKANVKGKEQRFSIPCLTAVEYYWERSSYSAAGYQFWLLVRIPHEKSSCNLPFYKSYGSSAFLRSLILPGWGQIYKKEQLKGYSIMAVTLSSISLCLVAQNQYSVNYEYARQTQNYEMKLKYINTGDNWATVRTVSGITAGAFYIYNVIDALASKGEKMYARRNSNIIISPMFDKPGVLFSLTIPINLNNKNPNN
jgi:hypothetical protein